MQNAPTDDQQPAPATSPAPLQGASISPESAALGGGMPTTFYLGILKRYAWHIATFVILATAASALTATALPKLYEATAVLRIDPAGVHTLGENGTEQTANQPDDSRMITTEAREVTSPAVVSKTIEDLQLSATKEFGPKAPPGGTIALSAAQLNATLARVTAAIGVDQPLDTYLLRVSFRSRDPQLSAEAANGLLASLIQHDANTRVQALMSSTKSMRAQLASLGAQMEKSQEALVDYESKHDVLNPDSPDNIVQSRLSQVSKDLGVAQTKRMQLQADEDTIQGGNLDALLASDQGKTLLPQYTRLQDDQRQLARMAQVYGPNYPLYRQQQALVANDQSVLDAQEMHLASQINSQYTMAASFEQLLNGELDYQKRQMDDFNLKAIRYNALKSASDSYTKLYYELQQRIQDAEVAANLQTEGLRVISPAEPDSRPVYPRPLLTAFLALLISGIAATGAAIAVGTMNKTVASPEEIEHWFRVPVLASLPAVPSRSRGGLEPVGYASAGEYLKAEGELQQAGPFREGILTLHSALMLARGQEMRSLAICSSVPGEGKSTVAANLAAAFACLGSNTVLVDLDLRKPSVHRQFRISNRRGTSSLLRGQSTLDDVLIAASDNPSLSLVPAGPPPISPGELLHRGLAGMMEQLRARFDHILLDCPPVLGFADALVAANAADGTLLVIHAGKTERQFISGAVRQLRAANVGSLAAVLNNVSKALNPYYSYYSQAYGYQEDETQEPNSREAANAN